MADSKLIDSAIQEGLGLQEFLQRKFPNDNRLAAIKPKVDGPHQGYFPAGVICEAFECEFKRWTNSIKRYTKRINIIDIIIRRLQHKGQNVTMNDLIIVTRGGAGGGGQSWIHPRLMAHFLNYVCPEFAEEVIDIFTRFTTGDPRIAQETAALRAAAHQEELKAAKDDLEKQVELAKNYQAELAKRAEAVAELQKTLDCERFNGGIKLKALEQDLTALKADNVQYQAYIQARAEREAKLETELQDVSDERDDLQEALDDDSIRPRNIFKDMDPTTIPTSTRHQESRLWYAARNITINACIFQSRKNYIQFMDAVVDATHRLKMFNDRAKSDLKQKLTSISSRARNQARRLIYTKYKALKPKTQASILATIATETKKMFKEVFALDLTEDTFTIKICLNNIRLYQLLCSHLAVVYDVEHSTDIETKYLAKMALNMTEFTDGEFKVALGADYAEFDKHYSDVELVVD